MDCGLDAPSRACWPRHLVLLQPEVTREGRAKYNLAMNNTFSRQLKWLQLQLITIN